MPAVARPAPAFRPVPARPPVGRRIAVLLGLLALAACGGGGGGNGTDDPKPENPAPPGIAGTALLADVELGRIAEQEPNDGRAQPCRLAPVGPRTLLEVTGEVGVTAERFGHVDPVDVFRFQPLADQDVEVTLAFAEVDPVGLGANDLEAEIRDVATDALLASTGGGPPPRSTTFGVSGGAAYDLVVRCEAGHSAYVLSLRSTDPAGGAAVAKAGVGPAPARAAPPVAQDCAGTHVLVRLRAGADENALAGRFGLRLGRRTALGTWRMRFPEALAPAGRAARIAAWCGRLAADGAVLSVEPDWLVRPQAEPVEPNDPEYARQWNLRVVGAPGAWSVTRGDPDVVVGVVDTGVVDHPDLEGQLVDGYDFISEPSIAGDGDGRDPDPTDAGARDRPSGRSSWHGTHVAALVAGRADDGYGVTGLAPGCRVMPLRAVGIGGGLVSDVADAILYAAALYTTEDGHGLSEPLRVVNLSFAVDLDTEELRTACSRAANVGVLLVGTTGNTGLGVLYPARYDSVLAVAAVDRMLETTSYSNFGDEVALSAPGGLESADVMAVGWPDNVLSALLDDTVHPPVPAVGYLEGTSQAAPQVAAVAALLLSVDPTLTRIELRDYLQGSALDRGQPGWDPAYGWGVLQAQEALRLLLDDLGTPNPAPPCLWLQSTSLSFTGFEERHELVVMNAGGGYLRFGASLPQTDDGGTWLSVQNVLAVGSGPTQVVRIVVMVDQRDLPSSPGRHGGTIFVRDSLGDAMGTIRVIVHSGELLRAGRYMRVLVRRASNSSIASFDLVSPALGYRFWQSDLGAGTYELQCGTDLDGDGFYCETLDACGWYGGPTAADAIPVSVAADETMYGADILVVPPQED